MAGEDQIVRRLARWEWVALAMIVAVGGWLRFSHLDLLEFKSDEAIAVDLALRFVRTGQLPTAGLMSSVGVTNPPLFIYLLIPMFFVTKSIALVSCFIAAFGLAAIGACWWVGRKYYGPIAGLVAAAMFATSPWAVIYSRKIWAQDFVPVFVTGLMWAMHALVIGQKPKAVFWAVLLPLCVIQIHFSGLALTAMVVAILLLLRPKMDWRFAVAGLVTAAFLLVPYVQFQAANGWHDFKQAAAQIGGQKWNIPEGITIRPDSGYPLPRRPSETWVHALAIMNGGEIEDVLGLSTGKEFDRQQVWAAKGFEYFSSGFDWLLMLQRLGFAVAFGWLAWTAVKSLRASRRFPFLAVEKDRQAWILVLWMVVPLGVFAAAGLWTYLSYYVILYPAHFLVIGLAAERFTGAAPARRWGVATVVAVVVVGSNLFYWHDLNRFIGKYGGAQGTYGSGLGFKEKAVRYLLQQGKATELFSEHRVVQMDRLGEASAAQMEFSLLAGLYEKANDGTALPKRLLLLADVNRTNYQPVPLVQLAQMAKMNGIDAASFGPIWIYVLEKNQ